MNKIIDLQCARGELLNATTKIKDMLGLELYEVEYVLTSVLADIRAENQMILTNEYNKLAVENDELKSAKNAQDSSDEDEMNEVCK